MSDKEHRDSVRSRRRSERRQRNGAADTTQSSRSHRKKEEDQHSSGSEHERPSTSRRHHKKHDTEEGGDSTHRSHRKHRDETPEERKARKRREKEGGETNRSHRSRKEDRDKEERGDGSHTHRSSTRRSKRDEGEHRHTHKHKHGEEGENGSSTHRSHRSKREKDERRDKNGETSTPRKHRSKKDENGDKSTPRTHRSTAAGGSDGSETARRRRPINFLDSSDTPEPTSKPNQQLETQPETSPTAERLVSRASEGGSSSPHLAVAVPTLTTQAPTPDPTRKTVPKLQPVDPGLRVAPPSFKSTVPKPDAGKVSPSGSESSTSIDRTAQQSQLRKESRQTMSPPPSIGLQSRQLTEAGSAIPDGVSEDTDTNRVQRHNRRISERIVLAGAKNDSPSSDESEDSADIGAKLRVMPGVAVPGLEQMLSAGDILETASNDRAMTERDWKEWDRLIGPMRSARVALVDAEKQKVRDEEERMLEQQRKAKEDEERLVRQREEQILQKHKLLEQQREELEAQQHELQARALKEGTEPHIDIGPIRSYSQNLTPRKPGDVKKLMKKVTRELVREQGTGDANGLEIPSLANLGAQTPRDIAPMLRPPREKAQGSESSDPDESSLSESDSNSEGLARVVPQSSGYVVPEQSRSADPTATRNKPSKPRTAEESDGSDGSDGSASEVTASSEESEESEEAPAKRDNPALRAPPPLNAPPPSKPLHPNMKSVSFAADPPMRTHSFSSEIDSDEGASSRTPKKGSTSSQKIAQSKRTKSSKKTKKKGNVVTRFVKRLF